MEAHSGQRIAEVRKLKKTFRGNCKAVNEVSFSIQPNEVFALLGPNGSGKSTTIKMLLGLIVPDSGTISVLGHGIPRQSKKIMGRIGAILEGSRNLYWQRSVVENALYFAALRGLKSKAVLPDVHIWMNRLGLAEKAHAPLAKLSRGMQQKAALICSLAAKPEFLVLDEPLLGLDIMTRIELENAIAQLKKNTALLLSSHDLHFVERVADRAAVMRNGSIVAEGSIQELRPKLSRHSYSCVFYDDSRLDSCIAALQTALDGIVIDRLESDAASGTVMFDFTVKNAHHIYAVFEQLRAANKTIQKIETLSASFEDLFLQLIKEEAAR